MPSPPPISRAKNLVTVATKLPFNMSVTPLRAYQNSGSGKPRYGPPDAPLDSCPLAFARATYEDRDPLTFFSFPNGTTTYWYSHLQECARLVLSPAEGLVLSRSEGTHATAPALAGGVRL